LDIRLAKLFLDFFSWLKKIARLRFQVSRVVIQISVLVKGIAKLGF